MRKILLASLLLFLGCATSKPIKLPSYEDFVSVRRQVTSVPELEIYGRFTAAASGKSVKASFNLLLEPNKNAYLEILGPSKQMTNAFSLSRTQLTLLWAKEGEYIQEEATPENLQAITGFPVFPDDLVQLMAGYGLNFAEWKMVEATRDGWMLERPPFRASLGMKEQISRITVSSRTSPEVRIEYADYQMTNDRLVPRAIRISVPGRKIELRLQIDKLLPRDEPPTPDLFAVKLPDNAKKLVLKDIYNGKPLIY